MTISLPQKIDLSWTYLLYVYATYGLITYVHWRVQASKVIDRKFQDWLLPIGHIFTLVWYLVVHPIIKIVEIMIWVPLTMLCFKSPWKMSWHMSPEKIFYEWNA